MCESIAAPAAAVRSPGIQLAQAGIRLCAGSTDTSSTDLDVCSSSRKT
jgi:hypothetical protein